MHLRIVGFAQPQVRSRSVILMVSGGDSNEEWYQTCESETGT